MSQRASFKESIIFLVAAAAIILGAKLVHAKLVYDDARCAFADCRITVEGGK